MMTADARERLRLFEARIHEARAAYHGGAPIVSDAVFDGWIDQLPMLYDDMAQADCPHATTEPWRVGHPELGGPAVIRTAHKELVRRTWTRCLDCGIRLERVVLVQSR